MRINRTPATAIVAASTVFSPGSTDPPNDARASAVSSTAGALRTALRAMSTSFSLCRWKSWSSST